MRDSLSWRSIYLRLFGIGRWLTLKFFFLKSLRDMEVYRMPFGRIEIARAWVCVTIDMGNESWVELIWR